ncbi:MAG: hypothetical protein WC122_01975 [archaeon]|jgi:hypothetical protein
MVLGMGVGKIDIQLDKLNYSKGEEVVGKVVLDLKKKTKARGLKVTIFAETTSTKLTTKGMNRQTSRTFEFTNPLDSEKEYPTGLKEYEFKIKIPLDSVNNLEGMPGQILQAVKFISTGSGSTKWFIEAKLDIPMGFDLHKKTQINVA